MLCVRTLAHCWPASPAGNDSLFTRTLLVLVGHLRMPLFLTVFAPIVGASYADLSCSVYCLCERALAHAIWRPSLHPRGLV